MKKILFILIYSFFYAITINSMHFLETINKIQYIYKKYKNVSESDFFLVIKLYKNNPKAIKKLLVTGTSLNFMLNIFFFRNNIFQYNKKKLFLFQLLFSSLYFFETYISFKEHKFNDNFPFYRERNGQHPILYSFNFNEKHELQEINNEVMNEEFNAEPNSKIYAKSVILECEQQSIIKSEILEESSHYQKIIENNEQNYILNLFPEVIEQKNIFNKEELSIGGQDINEVKSIQSVISQVEEIGKTVKSEIFEEIIESKIKRTYSFSKLANNNLENRSESEFSNRESKISEISEKYKEKKNYSKALNDKLKKKLIIRPANLDQPSNYQEIIKNEKKPKNYILEKCLEGTEQKTASTDELLLQYGKINTSLIQELYNNIGVFFEVESNQSSSIKSNKNSNIQEDKAEEEKENFFKENSNSIISVKSNESLCIKSNKSSDIYGVEEKEEKNSQNSQILSLNYQRKKNILLGYERLAELKLQVMEKLQKRELKILESKRFKKYFLQKQISEPIKDATAKKRLELIESHFKPVKYSIPLYCLPDSAKL